MLIWLQREGLLFWVSLLPLVYYLLVFSLTTFADSLELSGWFTNWLHWWFNQQAQRERAEPTMWSDGSCIHTAAVTSSQYRSPPSVSKWTCPFSPHWVLLWMDGHAHSNGTVCSLRLFYESLSASEKCFLSRNNCKAQDLTRWCYLGEGYKIQPDLRGGSKACKILHDFDFRGRRSCKSG